MSFPLWLSDAPGSVRSTRSPGSVPGARLPVPSSSWSASFPPLTPQESPSLCSPTSLVLCCRPTPRGGWLQACGFLPSLPPLLWSLLFPFSPFPEVSRFSRGECPHMPGSQTPPERSASRVLRGFPFRLLLQTTGSASGL